MLITPYSRWYSKHSPHLGLIRMASSAWEGAENIWENMKIQLETLRCSFCHSHGTWSETKIFRSKERSKRNLKTPVWKANWASPNPNQFFMSLRCFHDTSTLPCAEVNSLYHEVGEFTVNSLFSISLEGWMYNLAYPLALSQTIDFHVFERTSWGILATSLNMFALHFDSNRDYSLIRSLLLRPEVRWSIKYLFRIACYH